MGDELGTYFLNAKLNMIKNHLKGRGIASSAVISAFEKVPREKLIPSEHVLKAYEDRPLDIGFGVTISQPYIVAKTIECALIQPGCKVLEIGTGSGYQTALLEQMGAKVYTIELIKDLSLRTQKTLKELGYKNIKFKIGNGYDGWPGKIKFDTILLSAAPKKIPEKLLDQLKPGGCLVGPEGDENNQWLIRITKTPHGLHREKLLQVRFVPMIRD